MNLKSKKELIARTLNVGVNRILLNRAEDIKEAITRQDIRDLVASRSIIIKMEKGRKKVEKRKRRRGEGNVKKTIKERKKNYVRLTRKLRGFIKNMKKKNRISSEKYRELRKKIRGKEFKSLAYMQEHIIKGDLK